CASFSPMRSARIPAACGTPRPTRSWTRTVSAAISAAWSRPIRKWRSGWGSCPNRCREKPRALFSSDRVRPHPPLEGGSTNRRAPARRLFGEGCSWKHHPSPKFASLRSQISTLPQGEGMRSKQRTMKARVFVTLKNGVLDPQGKAIGHALNNLGFEAVGDVRQGKVIDIELAETNADKAHASLRQMCEKLLANTVIEKYEIEIRA